MIVIYNEDCFKTMDNWSHQQADVILTSPPYNTGQPGTNLASRKNHVCRYDVYNENMTDPEYIEWTLELFKHYDKVLKKDGVILYNISYSTEKPDLLWFLLHDLISKSEFMIADCLIWKKGSALPNNRNVNKMTRFTEFVFVFCRRDEYNTYRTNKVSTKDDKFFTCFSNFIETKNNDGSQDLNKATFSVDFVKELLKRYAIPGSLVYDSFMGTGTTAVACKEMGYDVIGSELSEAQCKLASEWLKGIRFSKPKSVKRLF